MIKENHLFRLVVICIFVCLCMTGCRSNNRIDEEAMSKGDLSIFKQDEIDHLYEEQFVFEARKYQDQYDLIEQKECLGKNVKGILCRENDIIVTDKENSKLFVLNKAGNILEEIGRTGNGQMEFLGPTGIAQFNQDIYILDSGNLRIQVLDDDFNYINNIILPKEYKDETSYLDSIAIDEKGNIYMASSDYRCSYILCFDAETEKFIKLGKNFCGTVSESSGKVYAINLGLVTGKDKKSASGIRTGINYLYSVTNLGMVSVCELPYGITATGFTVLQDKLICVSGTYHTVDIYSLKGEYEYSLAQIEDMSFISSLASSNNNEIYVGLEAARKLVCIEKEKE